MPTIKAPVLEDEFTDDHVSVRINENTSAAFVEMVGEINAALAELAASLEALEERVAAHEAAYP